MRKVAVAAVVVALWLIGAGAAWGDTITAICTVGNAPAQPCAVGWYTSPVFVSWTWDPLTTGSGNCPAGPYAADTTTAISCTVSWPDGFTGTQSYKLRVEVSSPTATATLSRPPDSGGWYNQPLAVTFQGSSFSGIASCTPATTYSGPDNPSATVTGTCTDNAGKTVTVTSSPFAWNATPPSLTASADPGDRSVALSWQTGPDIAPLASIEVVRSRGPAGAAGDPVYTGTSAGYRDTHVRNGVHYTYTVTAIDQAGNASTQTVTATPGARLVAPVDNAHVASPPLLRWTSVRRATYYNVQLYRAGKTKMLSMWPKNTRLQLRRTWRYHGRKYSLRPGRYKWYVWPGFGKRKAARYGHRIGTGTFVVAR